MTTNEYSYLFTALEELQETLVGISGAGGGIHFIDAQYYAAAVIKAIELLKAQQPRVIPLKELADEANHCFDVVWHEVKGGNVVPRRVQPCGHMLKVKSFYTEPYLADGATYNITWRCWTARPTDEQREATPWGEPPKEET